jgi:Tfp pilus tip-associated adhesin PilY1
LKTSFFRLSCILTAAAALCGPVGAEDIDLFVTPNTGGQFNPNILIMIDNSANWDANNQHWVGVAGGGLVKQGQSELRSIWRVLDEVDDKVNLGLALFTPGPGTSPNGGYIRFHVRTMNGTNKAAFKELIGTSTCVNGANSLNTTANCIFNNFSTPSEKVGTAKTDYSAGLFDVFKYFGGYTDPAHAHVIPAVAGTPVDASHFGTLRYARNGNTPDPNSDPAAYTGGATKPSYVAAIDPAGTSCGKNFLVFIGNGFPVQDSPCSLLQGVNGVASCPGAQLLVPQFTMVTNNVTSTLGTDAVCRTAAACATAAATTFPGYDTYACSGGTATPNTPLGNDATCETAAACATRAQTNFPGHTSYFCTGGTTSGGQTGTDLACETVAACTTRAATVFPGASGYTCTGGATVAGNVNLGTDTNVETAAQCATRAQTNFPGYTSYSCVSGTGTATTTTNLGPSGAVCETAAACATRMAGLFPGHTSIACSAGVNVATYPTADGTCHNAAQCQSAAQTAIPTAASWSCTGGTTTGCSGGKKINETMQGTCAAGKLAHQTVTASDTTFATQIMQGTGCTVAGRLSGQTMSTTSCLSNQAMTASDSCITGQTITGTKAVNTVTPTNTSAAPSSANFADEWAKYLYSTDVSAATGFQNIQTYTIDVFKDAQDPNETGLLMSMAKYGGGRYFQATDENSILNALREILVEIQSVNSVFASASLPISAANRSQNENQIFIGMFRPDPQANPRWYGNLKRYQVAIFGADAKLADKDGKEALAATTGFIQACATSYYTTDSNVGSPATTTYWNFSPYSAGTCTSVANSTFNDLPDGGIVEKGSAAEVLRKGNSTSAVAPFTVNRTMKTCATAPCTSLVDFTSTNVTMARTGAPDVLTNNFIVDFSFGKDVKQDHGGTNIEPRPSIHGDITHSRPLPVNFGGTRGVEVYYGSNDGAFHALKGADGTEIWSFIAPEHHGNLKRLYDNLPKIIYPPPTANDATAIKKDYFFDGSSGLYETFNADNTANTVWIFPSQRRGGRMLYGFDVSTAGAPVFKWAKGCPSLTSDTVPTCTPGMSGIGETWSVPNIAFIKGYSATTPVAVVGGGYDDCEDTDSAVTTCTASTKGNKVYVLDAGDGHLIRAFDTDRAVPADITLIDRDFDGKVDHAYVADAGGSIYRIDFVDPATMAARASGSWTITKIAHTTGGSRKFLFGPAALATTDKVYLAVGSGDRERPLISNYPYVTPVNNRFYMLIDKFPAAGVIDLDGSTMDDFSSATTCNTSMGSAQDGWRMDLNSGTGEQTVTSSVIFGGTVFFSTNRPTASAANSCATNLGEARGYAVNLLNASGVIGSGAICGGGRSDTFVGGGIPPSPVVGTVQVNVGGVMKTIPLLIGAANIAGDAPSFSIGGQQPPVPIKQIRSRVYWYRHGDK